MFNLTHKELKSAEKSIYSQGMQDGILEAIFNQLGIKKGIYCSWGERDGIELSNTAHLRLNHGWRGILIDAEPLSPIVEKEYITAENVNHILAMYKVGDVDLLCMDIDGNEAYVLDAIKIKPKVVVSEFNSKFSNDESYAIEYNPFHKWEGDDYYGASLLALNRIMSRKGYTLIYTVAELDAIFIRNDLLDNSYIKHTLDEIFPAPIIAHEKVSNKKWVEIK